MRKILLIATRQIGDVLLVTPLLRSLRRGYPDSIIDVLVYDNKGGMLEGNPDYNNLISVAEHPNFSQYKILFKRIFRRYDLAVSTLGGDRPLIYALLAARKRVSLVPAKRWQDAWKRWITAAYAELDNDNTHTVIQNLRLADLLGIKRYYQIVIPKADDSVLNNYFDWQQVRFAVLHLLPMWHYKRWTISGWCQLIDYLLKMDLYVVLTGGNSEVEKTYINNVLLIQQSDNIINLAGKLRFSDVAELISNSQVYVGPDTAVTHLAAATGTKTIALYGPTNPVKWAPWSEKNNVVLVQGVGDCVPCHQEGCERHKQSFSRCLEQLDSSVVIRAIKNENY